MLSLPFAAAGAAAWSLAEYCLHRFAGHGPRRKHDGRLVSWLTPAGFAAGFQEEHVAHHVDPTYFAPAWKKAAAAVVGVPVLGGVTALVVGPRRGVSFAIGFMGAYLGYEVIHRRVHTHAPRGAFTRWVDRNHLHHHVNPRANHGVTSPLWDLAFGTHTPLLGPVRLHVRMAPSWMTDPSGKVRPEHAADYEVFGRRPPAEAAAA